MISLQQEPVESVWRTLTHRTAFGFGLVIGIAILGVLALTARNDVRLLWYEDDGRLAIGILQTETRERLLVALRELENADHQLQAERNQRRAREEQLGSLLRTYEERVRVASQRVHEVDQELISARKKVAELLKTKHTPQMDTGRERTDYSLRVPE